MASSKKEVLEVAGREVTVSNPDKVFFPETGHTKIDLVRYYLAVADGALRGAGGRPNVLVRYPNGVGDEFFYQKRAPSSRPAWIEVVALKFPSGRTAEEVVPRQHALPYRPVRPRGQHPRRRREMVPRPRLRVRLPQ